MRFNNMKARGNAVLIGGDEPKFDGNTFSVRTEPGVQATKLPEAIPIVGGACKYVDAKYTGDMNLADNTVAVAAMDQEGSEWRKVDSVTMQLRYNYLGLGIKKGARNLAFNKQFRITQEQAISAAYASQLTELEFMGQQIISEIPQMEGAIFNGDADTAATNSLTGSGQFASLIWYQSFLQNCAIIMGKYNTLMCFADYLISMGYNAESALILRFMNLMKKQNIWTVFDQLGNILQSQFFDLPFYNEITSINAIPCRKSNSVGSPLITMLGSINMPEIAIFPSDAPHSCVIDWKMEDSFSGIAHWRKQLGAALNDSAFVPPITFTIAPPAYTSWYDYVHNHINDLGSVTAATVEANAKLLDSKRSRYSATVNDEADSPHTYDLQQLIEKIAEELSFHNILRWARSIYFRGGSSAETANAKAGHLIRLVGALVDITSRFRSDTVDLTTFLRVLQNSTTMNTWVLDTPYLHPSVPRAQVGPVYFKLIYDILTSYGTSGEMVLDDNTKGWDIYTWWHIVEGIPKYDAYDGGFTMAASIRGIPADANVTYEEPQYMIPVLFDIVPGSIKFLSRQGKERTLSAAVVTKANIQNDPIFAGAQLMDLPDTITIPLLSFGTETGVSKMDYSQAIRTLTSLFGIGRIQLAASDGGTQISFMDANMEGLVGRTFANANTMALNYINSRAPFRTTNYAGASLGFQTR